MIHTRDIPEGSLYDKRILERNLEKNLFTHKDLERRLKELPDQSEHVVGLEARLTGVAPGAGPRAVTPTEEDLDKD